MYDVGSDYRDFPLGWDLLCAVSMCILTTPTFSLVGCCMIYSSTVEGITTRCRRRIIIDIVNVFSGEEVVSKS